MAACEPWKVNYRPFRIGMRRMTFRAERSPKQATPRCAARISPHCTPTALLIVEIKSSIADFRHDQKWRDYCAHCDRLFFAISDVAPAEIMPAHASLIVADSWGAEIVRDVPPRTMHPAIRRAVLMRFAIAAADRLHRLADPNGGV